ncbi:MAG: restriction endonuclease subunit S [Gemmataceae bacterium]|nr:restriction endonuclease subunit S [Gemmataceae bacterium]
MVGEWKRYTIDQLKADTNAAIAIGPFGSRMKSDTYVPVGVPVIRGNNISDTKEFVADFVYITPVFADQLRSQNVTDGDLVFPHRGNIGTVGIVGKERPRYVLSTSLMKLTCNRLLADPLFLFYFFRSPVGHHRLMQHASTVGTPGIGSPLASLRSIAVDLPPLPEQRAIAGVLGALDDKIELNRRRGRTLEGLARAVFRSWFVDFDPVRAKAAGRAPAGLSPAVAALFPDALADSPLGPIPAGWRVSTVGANFRLTMGQSPPGSTYNETREGLPFYQGRTDFGFRFPTRRVYCTAPTRLAEPGDTLVSVRAPVGDINIASERCAVGRGVAAVRHVHGSRSLTYHAMDGLRDHFLTFEAEGTVFGSINKSDFAKLPFLESTEAVLSEFERLVSPLDDQVETIERESATLAALRDALLPKLISGELRVPAAARAVGRVT